MGVGGIGSYDSSYYQYRLNSIPRADSAVQEEATEVLPLQTEESPRTLRPENPPDKVQRPESDRRSRNADLENIALTFYPSGDGDNVGKDSDLRSLDMQKAISDKEKDRILEDYEYFVGSSQQYKEEYAGMDGIVLQKR